MADIRCPTCHELDQVSKVTAIVSAGTSKGTSVNAVGYTIETRGQTDLSAALAPPVEPSWSLNTPQGNKVVMGCIGWFAAIGGLLLLTAIPQLIYHFIHPATGVEEILPFVETPLGLIFLGIFYWLYRGEKGSPRERARFEEKMESYREAREKWEQLYYCFRDDGVFLPDGQSELIPKKKLKDFLYS